MPHLDWQTMNRLTDADLAGGMLTLAGVGALGRGPDMGAINAAARKKAAELSRTVPLTISRLDATMNTALAALDQAQQLAAAAQDLASQATSTAPLTLVDRFGTLLTALEEAVARAQAEYDKIPALPRFVEDSADWTKNWNEGWLHPAVHTEWPAAERAVQAAATAVKAAAGTVPRLLAQAQGIYKQIQTVVQREQAAVAQREAREAQAQALIDAREAQRVQLEQAKFNQQMQLENARAQAEMQREMALNAPMQAPPGLPQQSASAAWGMPPAPPGYMYVDPTTQQPSGPQPTYAAQQFELPGGYGYSAFSAQAPLPQAAPQQLTQNWQNVEYDALMAGEAQYLRGLGSLGAGPLSAATIAKMKAAIASTPGYAPGTSTLAKGGVSSSGSSFGVSDVTDIIGALGASAASVLPAFGFNVPRQESAPAPTETNWGTVAAVGVAGAAVLAGIAYLASGKKPSRTRSRRRR